MMRPVFVMLTAVLVALVVVAVGAIIVYLLTPKSGVAGVSAILGGAPPTQDGKVLAMLFQVRSVPLAELQTLAVKKFVKGAEVHVFVDVQDDPGLVEEMRRVCTAAGATGVHAIPPSAHLVTIPSTRAKAGGRNGAACNWALHHFAPSIVSRFSHILLLDGDLLPLAPTDPARAAGTGALYRVAQHGRVSYAKYMWVGFITVSTSAPDIPNGLFVHGDMANADCGAHSAFWLLKNPGVRRARVSSEELRGFLRGKSEAANRPSDAVMRTLEEDNRLLCKTKWGSELMTVAGEKGVWLHLRGQATNRNKQSADLVASRLANIRRHLAEHGIK